MAKPHFEQVQEFFRQVDANKINSASFQLFLDGLRKVQPLSLKEYEEMVRGLRCRTTGCVGPLGLQNYDHEGGWQVEGFSEKQWLYTECRHCANAVSLRHWGIERGLLKQL